MAAPPETAKIPPREKNRFWKGVVSWELEELVVEIWLSTGLNPDGSESPRNKTIPDELYVWSTVGSSKLVNSRSNDLIFRADQFPRSWSRSLLSGNVFDARILLYALIENERKEYLCRCRFARLPPLLPAKTSAAQLQVRDILLCHASESSVCCIR